MKRKQEVAGTFSRAAESYDRVGPRFFTHFGERLVALAQVPRGARVLDIATGRGALLFPAALAAGPAGHVTGIDLSETMVQQTAAEISRLKLENVDVRQMDAEQLQFPEAAFDLVLCGFAFFFFPEPERALTEMRRTLKPGGRLAISTWDRSGDAQWEWFEAMVKQYLPAGPQAEDIGASPAEPQPEFDRQEWLETFIGTAGFSDVHVVFESGDFIYPDAETWWSSLWSHGARSQLEKVEQAAGSEGLGRFKAQVLEYVDNARAADGVHWVFPALFTLATKA